MHGQPKFSTPAVGFAIRLTSSQVSHPTSPSQTSFVPGLNVNRNGFRRPWAMIRRALTSEDPMSGLPAIAAPVFGSSRRIDPSRDVGSLVVRRSWARSAPPSAVGTDLRASRAGRGITARVGW